MCGAEICGCVHDTRHRGCLGVLDVKAQGQVAIVIGFKDMFVTALVCEIMWL